VRYLAVDFGGRAIRVNAISAGPIRTLAGAGINDARYMFAFQQQHSPLKRGVTLDELGGAGLGLQRHRDAAAGRFARRGRGREGRGAVGSSSRLLGFCLNPRKTRKNFRPQKYRRFTGRKSAKIQYKTM
jgi:Enoyl-(Acyl carrier protein) reductase